MDETSEESYYRFLPGIILTFVPLTGRTMYRTHTCGELTISN